MKNNNMRLDQWMVMKMMPWAYSASKYTIGQYLTDEDAKNIKGIFARSVDFELEDIDSRQKLNVIGSPYRDFIVCYVLLMVAGKDQNNWWDALRNALDPVDRAACEMVVRTPRAH